MRKATAAEVEDLREYFSIKVELTENQKAYIARQSSNPAFEYDAESAAYEMRKNERDRIWRERHPLPPVRIDPVPDECAHCGAKKF